jgi:HSP20 family protein
MNDTKVIGQDWQRGQGEPAGAAMAKGEQASGGPATTQRDLQTTAQGAQNSQNSQSESMRAMLPPCDIAEDEAGITLLADLPGVSRERLAIKVTGDNLVIEGTADVPIGADMELLYGEVPSPHYRRSFTLSRELDPAKIDAKLTNGVLRLRIPKAEEARPRRIEVSVG